MLEAKPEPCQLRGFSAGSNALHTGPIPGTGLYPRSCGPLMQQNISVLAVFHFPTSTSIFRGQASNRNEKQGLQGPYGMASGLQEGTHSTKRWVTKIVSRAQSQIAAVFGAMQSQEGEKEEVLLATAPHSGTPWGGGL